MHDVCEHNQPISKASSAITILVTLKTRPKLIRNYKNTRYNLRRRNNNMRCPRCFLLIYAKRHHNTPPRHVSLVAVLCKACGKCANNLHHPDVISQDLCLIRVGRSHTINTAARATANRRRHFHSNRTTFVTKYLGPDFPLSPGCHYLHTKKKSWRVTIIRRPGPPSYHILSYFLRHPRIDVATMPHSNRGDATANKPTPS